MGERGFEEGGLRRKGRGMGMSKREFCVFEIPIMRIALIVMPALDLKGADLVWRG